ncbi:MAG: hypothetical protein JWN07_2312 [Hyphomicrobiales bacterium]|nr:hypothetical protein [Hyphomicrobiales bacterium]
MRSGLARIVRVAAQANFEFWLLFAVLPVSLPFVRRAGPPLLVLAALVAVVRLMSDESGRKAVRTRLRDERVLVGVLFLGWATATLLWSPWPSRGAAAVASGWLMFGAFLALVCDPALRRRPHFDRVLTTSVAAGAALVALDLALGRGGWNVFHKAVEPFRANMVLVSLVLLACACLPRLRTSTAHVFAMIAVLVVALAAGESETAKLAFVAAAAACLAAYVLPLRILSVSLAAVLCLVWFGFFWFAPVAEAAAHLLPWLARAGHAAERLQIWNAFAHLAVAGYPMGWGVESVAMAPTLPYFATAPEVVQAGLAWMHPHNNIIQIAAEMGLPGLVLGWGASMVAVWWVQADPERAPPRAALAAAILTVALVSHGFWQMWFWSAAAVSVLSLIGPTSRDLPAATRVSGEGGSRFPFMTRKTK